MNVTVTPVDGCVLEGGRLRFITENRAAFTIKLQFTDAEIALLEKGGATNASGTLVLSSGYDMANPRTSKPVPAFRVVSIGGDATAAPPYDTYRSNIAQIATGNILVNPTKEYVIEATLYPGYVGPQQFTDPMLGSMTHCWFHIVGKIAVSVGTTPRVGLSVWERIVWDINPYYRRVSISSTRLPNNRIFNKQTLASDVVCRYGGLAATNTILWSQATITVKNMVVSSVDNPRATIKRVGQDSVINIAGIKDETVRFYANAADGFAGEAAVLCSIGSTYRTASGVVLSPRANDSNYFLIQQTPQSYNPPYPPTDLTAEVVNETNVRLEWVAAEPEFLGYHIYRRTGTGPWAKLATLPSDFVVYDDKRLAQNTEFSYYVVSYNNSPISPESAPTETVTVTTGVLEGVPAAPENLRLESADRGAATILWDSVATALDGYIVYRGATETGEWVEIGRSSADVMRFVDEVGGNGLTVFYAVSGLNENGEGDLSDPLGVYVPPPRSALQPVSRFSLTPGCNLSMCQVAGRVLVFSDLDRPVVYVNRKWFLQGLKPLRNAPVVSAGGSGKMSGTVAAFVCLFRSDDVTRSVPSPISNWLAVTDKKITITLHANDRALDNSVISRDIGYNQSGQQIAGCDYWEIYLTEEDIAGAYLVARVPITVSEFTVDYEVGDLLDGSHRPMETANQSLIPPACAYSVYRNSRVYIFGERTIKPTQDDADATITMANASRLFSTSDYTLTDALYHKELYINKTGTGWFVVDVIDANNAEIMHFDPEINKGGFQGVSGTYSDFAFAGKPSRVYASAYFSGEASGGITFSPETYPPTTIFEDEFDPDDNQDGNGAIASRDAIFFFKPSKAFFITGGETPDFPLLGVTTISRGSGLLAPKTLCRDRYDRIYYLSDQGPHMAHQGGVEKIGTMSGNAFLFQRYFDVGTAGGAVGTWFSRDDYFVVFGLNRRGRSGGRDGFIYDSRTNQVCPFTTPKRITSCVQTTTDSGDYQLLVGDENGHVGTFLTADVYGDLRDYGSVDPLATEEVVPCFIRSGLIAAQRGLTPQWFVPRVKMIPDDSTPLAYTVGFDGKTRSDDPTTYAADVSRTVTTALTNRVRVGGRRMQNCVVGFEFNAPTEGRVEWSGLEVTLNVQGTS